jgi:hypothetical protein
LELIQPSRRRVRLSGSKAINHERIEKYLREMGIDDGLFRAAFAIPFESKRFLEREEVVHFGLDREEFEETPWRYVDKPAPTLIKEYFARSDDAKTRYLDGAVTLSCTFAQTLRLGLVREHNVTEISGDPTLPVSINMNGQRFDLAGQNTSQQIEGHSASLWRSVVDALRDDSTLELSAPDLARNNGSSGGVLLSMKGFSTAYAKWRVGCDELARNAGIAWMQNADARFLSPKSAAPLGVLSLGQLPLPGAWRRSLRPRSGR